MALNKVKGADLNTAVILGTYEGECADANITNENGLDITREVWETVFASDEYKKAINLGWYIGYLGHPEDPNCMDFQHSCIVMREGHIDNSGKLYGKFDLIDTPVGRTVKALTDAGVQFGISVRGVGDIENNSVDPDTFIFRGFDLVTFPAYPDAIPQFSDVAASTDLEKRKAYKKVCAAIHDNIEGLNTVESVNILQSHFAPQSDEYKELEKRKKEIKGEDVSEDMNADGLTDEETAILAEERQKATMDMYLRACSELDKARKEISSLRRENGKVKLTASRQLKSMKRIVGSQLEQANMTCEELQEENEELEKAVSSSKKQNLIYKQEISAARKLQAEQSDIISKLKSSKSETVTASKELESRASNLGEHNKALEKQVVEMSTILKGYQKAYASLYASLTGVSLKNVDLSSSITCDTSVSALESIIKGATNTSNVGVAPSVGYVEDDEYYEDDYDDYYEDEDDDEEVIVSV